MNILIALSVIIVCLLSFFAGIISEKKAEKARTTKVQSITFQQIRRIV